MQNCEQHQGRQAQGSKDDSSYDSGVEMEKLLAMYCSTTRPRICRCKAATVHEQDSNPIDKPLLPAPEKFQRKSKPVSPLPSKLMEEDAIQNDDVKEFQPEKNSYDYEFMQLVERDPQ
jgi:hypothetical protein